MDSDWLTELRAAHDELAALLGTDSGYEAWDRISALIQTGPPVSAQDALPEISDEDDLSIKDQHKEVLRALYEAATSGNVTAVIKWLELHKGQLDDAGLDLSALKRDRRDPEGFAIYRHVHRESGKDYVGVTEYGSDRRWVQHIRDAGLGSSQPLHQAIREFGAEAFDHEVLERCPTRNEANAAERKWIAHFQSNKTGYNLDAGGGVHSNEGEPGRRSGVESEELSVAVARSAMIGELEDAFSGTSK